MDEDSFLFNQSPGSKSESNDVSVSQSKLISHSAVSGS